MIHRCGRMSKCHRNENKPILQLPRKMTYCNNYREISLLDVSEVFAPLAEFLQHCMTAKYILIRFKSGRGCANQIFMLGDCSTDLNADKSPLLCFIDFVVAFDSIKRDVLCQIVQHRWYFREANEIRLINEFYRFTLAQIYVYVWGEDGK